MPEKIHRVKECVQGRRNSTQGNPEVSVNKASLQSPRKSIHLAEAKGKLERGG